MSSRAVLAMCLTVLCACQADEDKAPHSRPSPGANTVHLNAQALAAYQRLLHAERFADSMVGEGGDLPPEADDLRLVVKDDTNGSACGELFEKGTMSGRLFALCGLWWRDPVRFEKGVAELRKSTEFVTFQSGCETEQIEVRELVHQRNGIVLDGRKQSLLDWLRLHPDQSSMLDIEGGGYPQRLLDLPPEH